MKNRRRDKAIHKRNLESNRPVPWQGRPRTALLVASAVAVVAAWAYATSLAGVFVFDDWPAIVENSTIRSLSLEVLAPPAHATVSGRPVANLTFAMNQALAPASAASPVRPGEVTSDLANVRGFHAANLIIHVAAALALSCTEHCGGP